MQFRAQHSENQIQTNSYFDSKSLLLLISLALLFIFAFAIRVYNLTAPGILPEREFRSMLLARAYYYEKAESIPPWENELAQISKARLGELEPSILEFIVSRIYILSGEESIKIVRILTSIFWVIGGIFFYLIAKRVMPTDPAVIATVFYLFFPLGILVSRSFQPESLMIFFLLASLYSILIYFEQPSTKRLLIAGVISGLTLLIKPLPIFTLFSAYISISIFFKKEWKQVIDRKFLIYSFITISPAFIYYSFGILGEGFLNTQAQMSFRPYLLLHREFWQNWLITGVGAVGYLPLIASLFSLPMLSHDFTKSLLIGLWTSYFIFGLVFTHHIHTHNYYHLQFALIIGLSLGPLITTILSHFKNQNNFWYRLVPVIGACLLLIFFNVREVRAGLRAPHFESPELAKKVGELVNHSSRVVYISRHYGQSLEYYGEMSGTNWPKAIEYWLYRRPDERLLSIDERFRLIGYVPEYIIITDFDGYNHLHADLKEFLEVNCYPYEEGNDFLIYDASCFKRS